VRKGIILSAVALVGVADVVWEIPERVATQPICGIAPAELLIIVSNAMEAILGSLDIKVRLSCPP